MVAPEVFGNEPHYETPETNTLLVGSSHQRESKSEPGQELWMPIAAAQWSMAVWHTCSLRH
jgi:hypothetical protein